MYYAICSNPSCNYSAPFQSEAVEKFDTIRKAAASDFEKDIAALLPKSGPCLKCGSELLLLCPKCRFSLFVNPNLRICPECSKPIKEDEQDSLPQP